MTTQATPPSEVLLVVVFFPQLGKIKKGTAKIFFSSWEKISPQYGNYTKKVSNSYNSTCAFLFLQPADALADDFGFAIGAVDDGGYLCTAHSAIDNDIYPFAKEFVDEFGVGDIVALHAVG